MPASSAGLIKWLALSLWVCLMAMPQRVPAAAEPDLREIIQSELACAVLDPLFAEMPVEPLYSVQDTACSIVVPDGQPGQSYFIDAACTEPVLFTSTATVDYCRQLLDASALGEGQGISAENWTLSPGSKFDNGARSLDGVVQPYLQRLIYRRVPTDAGVCELEMRVYSRHPNRRQSI